MKLKRSCMMTAAALLTIAALSAPADVVFTVDTGRGHRAISPLIYGHNPGGPGGLAQPVYRDLNATFARMGGNRLTAYNFLNNASNAGSDWKYENDDFMGGGNTSGGAMLPFVRSARDAGAGVLMTVPMAGYVAADFAGPLDPKQDPARSPHFVPEYPTRGDDPNPAANHVYQIEFVKMVAAEMSKSPKLVLGFCLDNEPDLWNSTHPEVHPRPASYAEYVQRSIAYAKTIKQVDSSALVFGPVSYGWAGFQKFQDAPDAHANGNFLNYYLKQMSAASAKANQRLLDVLDLHWYPEATGIGADGKPMRIASNDTSPGVDAARMEAPRSLWDPTYVETSWITDPHTGPVGTEGKPIDLIHRMQQKIDTNYPGTKLSFSEYNYGGGSDISGAIAEADVLGIFGKYGVFAANEWPNGPDERFILAAIKMFRNYDGRRSTFGGEEISATTTDARNTSIYAATDSADPSRLTIILINKQNHPTDATIVLAGNRLHTNAAVYQLTAAVPDPRNAGTLIAVNPIRYSMPAQSISTITLNESR